IKLTLVKINLTVASMKHYEQACAIARALDVVGERWSLLLGRELTLGPRRYRDLAAGLPGIPSNVLATRLKDLQAAGVLTRRTLPTPTDVTVYELTDAGRALQPALKELLDWGRRYAPEPSPDDAAQPGWGLLGAAGRPAALPAGQTCELRVGPEFFYLGSDAGKLTVRRGPAPQHRRRRHRDRLPRPGAARRSTHQASPRHVRRQAEISPRPSNKSTCHLETNTHSGEPVMSEIRSKTARAAAPGGVAAGGPRPGLALLVLAAAQLMVVLDATIVNVALPHIQRALGFSGSGLEWVVNAYALAFGGLLLLGGRAGDRLGRRTMFIAGLLLFSAASLAGGFADSEAFLLTARAVQGAGGALVAPAALALITTTFAEGPPRTRAFGVYAAMSIAGGAIGLIGGGLLVTYASWRWVLFVNVPIGAAVALAAPRVLAESPRRRGRFDLPGAITGTV